MVLVAYGLFLLTFVMCGGEVIVNRPNMVIFGAVFFGLGGIEALLIRIQLAVPRNTFLGPRGGIRVTAEPRAAA